MWKHGATGSSDGVPPAYNAGEEAEESLDGPPRITTKHTTETPGGLTFCHSQKVKSRGYN